MNGPGDIFLTNNDSTGSCSLIAIISALGMSSCRGRAEAFARKLSSKLRVLGSQSDNEAISLADKPITNGESLNTWVSTKNESDHEVRNVQPQRKGIEPLLDFVCELESPGSPADECQYLRLVGTASNTAHDCDLESDNVCTSMASSHSSTDGPFFDSNVVLSNSLLNNSQYQYSKQPWDLTARVAENCLQRDRIQSNSTLSTSNNWRCNVVGNSHENEHLQDPTKAVIACESKNKNKTLPEVNIDRENDFGVVDSVTTDTTIFIQKRIITELQRESRDKPLNAETNNSDNKKKTLNTNSSNQLNLYQSRILEETKQQQSLKLDVSGAQNDASQNAFDREKCSNFSNYENDLKQSEELQEIKLADTLKHSTREESHLSVVDTSDDEDDCRPQRIRRCSSLKTGKTPPGTPGRKKIVRFADVLVLDLADVKTFLDEIPTIPKSAFEDLRVLESDPPIQLSPKSNKILIPLFQQPGGLSTFLDLIREKQVSLENAAVTDNINQTITGSVRVRNLDYHKSVHVRYTLDSWRSFADLQANYVDKSCDGFSDKFTFTLFGNPLHIGQRLEFAVRFQCKGQQFWDNNYGTNYCFQCLPTSSPIHAIGASDHTVSTVGLLSPIAGDAWCTSLY